MILIDFSSIVHRMIHSSIANAKPTKKDGKYITEEFIGLTRYYIFQELFAIKQEFGSKFGDMVICLDKSSDGYWRRDFYPSYKEARKKGREESDIDYRAVFVAVDGIVEQLKRNIPWKVIEVPKAEADDIILVLAREYHKYEKILVHSPDKDMMQAQRNNNNVFQYSSLTKKWLVPENKHDNMDHWITEHVCLGDPSDDVPKIVEKTELSDSFLAHLAQHGFIVKTPLDFRDLAIDIEDKKKLVQCFDVYKKNRAGESTGEKDIYKDIRFGPTTLQKKIEEFGSLDAWLDSHPMYRKNYERNFILVMEEGIPKNIWNDIIVNFNTAETVYNSTEFERYLNENGLRSILMELPNVFKVNRELTADDFGW